MHRRPAPQSATESDKSPAGASVSNAEVPLGAFDFLNSISSGKPLSHGLAHRDPAYRRLARCRPQIPARDLTESSVPSDRAASGSFSLLSLSGEVSKISTSGSPASQKVENSAAKDTELLADASDERWHGLDERWHDFLNRFSLGNSKSGNQEPPSFVTVEGSLALDSTLAAVDSPVTYNILFLGESQSGKSTLIEFLKKYADPDYTINELNIGDGIFQCTKNVMRTTIHTDLPTSYVHDKTGDRVDYGKFLMGDHEDYEDELNERRAYRMEREKSTSDKVTFNLYDTPGLNDTTHFDEKNIASIFNALEKEKVPSIHLVVFTVGNNPFTEDLQNALKDYLNLLPDLNGNIIFVHTRIDYSKLHPDEESYVLTLKEKKRILHELIGRDTVPHVLIDNDIGSTRVIRNCMTQNRLRELLSMAKLNRPVSIQNKVVNKTEKMKIVDVILQEAFHDVITRLKEVLGQKKNALGEALSNVADLKAEIVKHEQDLEIIKRELSLYERDDLVLLYEERYDQAWSMMQDFNSETAIYYPGRALESLPGFINQTLDYIDTQEHNVEVIQQVGGISERYWAVRLRCQGSQNGIYHVKLYITREKMYCVYIENLHTKENAIKSTLAMLKMDLWELETEGQELPKAIQDLVDDMELHMYLLGRVSSKQLLLEDFQAMIDEDVYVHECSVSAANLLRFYLEKRVELERLEAKSRLRASLLDQGTKPPEILYPWDLEIEDIVVQSAQGDSYEDTMIFYERDDLSDGAGVHIRRKKDPPFPPVIEGDDRYKNDEPQSDAQETPTADLTHPQSPERYGLPDH